MFARKGQTDSIEALEAGDKIGVPNDVTNEARALRLLADNGIKGAEGGTALRNIILALGTPTDQAAKKLKELGVEVYRWQVVFQ